MLPPIARISRGMLIFMGVPDRMHKVVLEAKDDEELCSISKSLEENHIDHFLWREQPENIITALATKPYMKSAYGSILRHLRLLK